MGYAELKLKKYPNPNTIPNPNPVASDFSCLFLDEHLPLAASVKCHI